MIVSLQTYEVEDKLNTELDGQKLIFTFSAFSHVWLDFMFKTEQLSSAGNFVLILS